MIPAPEQQVIRKSSSDPYALLRGIDVEGNVQGNITVGHENVVGDHNVVYQVHTAHGAVVNLVQASPAVSPRTMRGQPLRPPRAFIGRDGDLDKIVDFIKRREAVVVYGRDGIGKTTLLAQASNSAAALAMPDGVVSLEGIDEEGRLPGPSDIIQRLFDALFESNPPLKVTSPSARPYLSNAQPLVILDHIDLQITALKSLPDLFRRGAVLVAMQEEPEDDQFLPVPLHPLKREESIQLLAIKSGIPLDGTSYGLMDEVCELLGDVPLAIAKVGTLIVKKKGTLEQLADRLRKVQPPSQDPIQAAIERAYGMVYSILEKDERKMLSLVAAAPGRSVERSWLERQAGGEGTSEALEALELLVVNSPRLRMSQGMRYVAQANMQHLEGMRAALLDHLLDQLKSRSLDFKFVGDELGNILGLMRWASNQGRWNAVVELGKAVDPYLTLHGLWDAWESVLKQALAAGQQLRDLAVRGWALHQLGTREIGVGSRNQAIGFLQRALAIRLSQGDSVGAAYTLHNLRLLLPQETGDEQEDTGARTRQTGTDGPGASGPTFFQKFWRTVFGNLWILAALLALAVIAAGLLRPSLRLRLQADPSRYSPVGQPIEISYQVDNAGLARLDPPINVYAGDQAEVTCPDLDTIGNEDEFFDWNETITCTGFYTITEADIARGSVTHSATASAGGRGPSSSDSITIQRVDKYLMVSLHANPATYRDAGETITIAFSVRSVGSEPLGGSITVAAEQLEVKCPDIYNIGDGNILLDASEFLACTARYTITDADVEAGSWTYTASVRVGDFRSDPQSVTVYRMLPAELVLKKSAKPETYQQAGQQIQYTYEITNQGTEPLNGPVVVMDDMLKVKCPDLLTFGNLDDLLDPGERLTCRAVYAVTGADLEKGSVTNSAFARTEEIESKEQSVTIYRAPAAILALDKSASPGTYEFTGQEIHYTYLVTNQGEGRLSEPVTVSDDQVEVVTCPPLETIGNGDGWFDPGESLTCSASYTISRADIDRRSVTNTAWASAGDIRSIEQPVTIHFKPPLPVLFKSARPTTYREVGEQINYTYVITNPGSVPMNGPISVKDDRVSVNCPEVTYETNQPSVLPPDEPFVCTGTYRITAADMRNGSVTNTATAFVGENLSDPQSVTIFGSPPLPPGVLVLTKMAEPETYGKAGEKIQYTYFITNTGKGPVKGPVRVEDDKTQVDCPDIEETGDLDGVLDPGEWLACTATYVITDADLETGSVTNQAIASAGELTSNPSSVTVTEKALDLTQSVDVEGYETAGQQVQYTYRVTGKSRLPLMGPVTIEDDRMRVACEPVNTVGDNDDFLDWNETVPCRGTYEIAQTDIDVSQPETNRGSVTNTAIASVYDVRSDPVSHTIQGPEQNPRVRLENIPGPDRYDTVGQKIKYTYKIWNDGNVTLSAPFTLADDHFENNAQFDCVTDIEHLAPGAAATCSNANEYKISQADFNFSNSSVTTNASASAHFREEPFTSDVVSTTVVCPYGREGWVPHLVESVESLPVISAWYNTEQGKSVEEMAVELQKTNCLGSSSEIAGITLHVPHEPPPAIVTGYVFADPNRNMIQDRGEERLVGLQVVIRNVTGFVITRTTTDANGVYRFSNLATGDYLIFQYRVSVIRGQTTERPFGIVPATLP